MDPGPFLYIQSMNCLLLCVYFLQTFTSFHSIRLILCFPQNTVRLTTSSQVGDKVLWLCCVGIHVATSTGSAPCQGLASNTFGVFPCSYWIDNLGFITKGNLLLCSSYLPLGVPNELYINTAIKHFSGHHALSHHILRTS